MPFHCGCGTSPRTTSSTPIAGIDQAQKRGVRPRAAARPAGCVADHSSLELAAQFVDQELHARVGRHAGRSCSAACTPPSPQLDDDDREVILMRHFEQLSNQEVAALHGLTEAAASMRYLRALRRLKELLKPE